MQAIDANAVDVALFAEVHHKVGVNAFPAYPRLHECGSAIQSVGECLGAEFGIALRRCYIKGHRLVGCQIGGTALQITAAIELTVVHGVIVALINGGHIIFFHAALE